MTYLIVWLVALLRTVMIWPKTIDPPVYFAPSPAQVIQAASLKLDSTAITLQPDPNEKALEYLGSRLQESPPNYFLLLMVVAAIIFVTTTFSTLDLCKQHKNFEPLTEDLLPRLLDPPTEDSNAVTLPLSMSCSHVSTSLTNDKSEAGCSAAFLSDTQVLCSLPTPPGSEADQSDSNEPLQEESGTAGELAPVLSNAQNPNSDIVTETSEHVQDLMAQLERSQALADHLSKEAQDLRRENEGLERRLHKMKRESGMERIRMTQEIKILKERVEDAEIKAYLADELYAEIDDLKSKLDEAGRQGEAAVDMIKERDQMIKEIFSKFDPVNGCCEDAKKRSSTAMRMHVAV